MGRRGLRFGLWLASSMCKVCPWIERHPGVRLWRHELGLMRTRMDLYYDYGYFPPEGYARIVADLPNHDVAYANGVLRAFVAYCARESAKQ